MSDSINDDRKEDERIRLSKIVPETVAKCLRQWWPDICNYNQAKNDLIKLGYKVEENGFEVKVWKEI